MTFNEFDLSMQDIAFAFKDVPTSAFPPEALIPKERQLAIFGSELDPHAFSSVGDMAFAADELSKNKHNAFSEVGNAFNKRVREIVEPE